MSFDTVTLAPGDVRSGDVLTFPYPLNRRPSDYAPMGAIVTVAGQMFAQEDDIVSVSYRDDGIRVVWGPAPFIPSQTWFLSVPLSMAGSMRTGQAVTLTSLNAGASKAVPAAILGDSRAAAGSNPTAYTTQATVDKSARGLQFWLEALSGGRVTCPNALNFGVSSETSTQILLRTPAAVAAAKAAGASVMIAFGCSTNDRTAGLDYATTIANLAAIESLIVSAGLICIWVAELPRGMSSDTSRALVGTQLANHVRVEQWQADRKGRPGVFVARPWSSLADISSVANAAAGYVTDKWLYDGLHPAPIAAHRIVNNHLLPIINSLFPAYSPLIQSAADVQSADYLGGAVNLNPFLLGSGGSAGTGVTGTVANGWTAQCNAGSGGSVAAVASVLANGGMRFVFSGTAGSTFDSFRLRYNTAVATRGVAVGALYKGSLAFNLAAAQTGIAGISFYAAGNNVDFIAAGQATQSTGANADLFPTDAIAGAVAIGEPAALPASSTDIAIGCRVIFRASTAVSATLDIFQPSARAA